VILDDWDLEDMHVSKDQLKREKWSFGSTSFKLSYSEIEILTNN